MNEGIEC